MNLITDIWRGLVRRKLWPVALALVAALVAVPFMLAKEPAVEPVPANLAAADEEGLPATFVTSAAGEPTSDEASTKRRRTLGAVKDPFEPAPLPKKPKSKKKTIEKDSAPAEPDAASAPAPSGGGAAAPEAPVVTATPTATPKPPPLNSIRVRFTRVEEEAGKAETVERFEVLPDEERPVLVYRGVEKGGKVAIFELTGNVVVEGDGVCAPTPEDCQLVKLRAGETQFITVTDTGEDTDAQYQLDLIKINARKK